MAVDPQRRMFDVPGASPALPVAWWSLSQVERPRGRSVNRPLGQRDTGAEYVFLTPQSEAENPLVLDV